VKPSPSANFVRAAALTVAVLTIVLLGVGRAMAEAERLAVRTGSARGPEALHLAYEHWDNPMLRLLTLRRVIVAAGAEQAHGCRPIEVVAISFFGVLLDRVRVGCDDSVVSLGP
jgi:hypothetical protein